MESSKTQYIFRNGKPAPSATRECDRCRKDKSVGEFYYGHRVCYPCEQKKKRFRNRIRATWAKKKSTAPDAIPSGMKLCGQCGETKPLPEFRTKHGKPVAPCKGCKSVEAREYRDRKIGASPQQIPFEIEEPLAPAPSDDPARGRPKTNFKVPKNASDTGTKPGEIRFTFIVNETDLEAIKALAHFNRTQIKDVLAVAIKNHLSEKRGQVIEALAKYRSRTPYQGVDLTPVSEQKPSVWRKLFMLGT